MPGSRTGPVAGTLAVALAACLFGTLGPISRLAYDAGMTPLSFSLWRAVLGALGVTALLVILRARGRVRVRWRTLSPRTLGALGLAILSSLILNLAVFSAFERTTIALALLGFYTYPVLVALAAVAIGEERLDRGRVAALGLALGGMVIVVLAGSPSGSGRGFEVLGFGLALLAAAMQAIYILLGRRGYRDVPSEEATFAVLAGVALGYLLTVALTGGTAGAFLPLRDPAVLPLLAWAGLGGAAVPTLLYLVAIRAVGPTRTAIVALLEPVAGASLAALLLGEVLGPGQVVGGVLVLLAAALLQRVEPGPVADHEAMGTGE